MDQLRSAHVSNTYPRRFCRLLAAALVALLAGWAPAALAGPSAVGTGAVKGAVTTADGVPIPGAVVTLAGNGPDRTLPVGTGGGFAFNGLPSGTYVVRASARGYNEVSDRTIEVGVAAVTNVDLVMMRSASSLVTIGGVRANNGATISTSSAPTTTLNTQAYAAQGYTYLSDVVQNDISTTIMHPLGGGSALPTPVSLRGPDPTETLVDIDGHQVNSGNTGSFDLSLLDPADYGNVELIKGISPSSLVGPDTIDGAINIRTIEPTANSHGLLRLFGGSYDSWGGTLAATGTDQRLGYALSLHRTTTAGEVNQSVVNATSGDVEQVGSAVNGSTALGKLRYSFGHSDGYVAFSFHDQSDYRDLSAALSSIPGTASSTSGGDSLVRRPLDMSSLQTVNSFAGTSLEAHNAGYALDLRLPLGAADANGITTTSALFRNYTGLVSQSVFGPGADTSPYLNNSRDLIGDNSLEIDHQFPAGALSLQYGIRNENLTTNFVAGVVNDQSVARQPLDSDPSQPAAPTVSQLSLGQTQRTAALRYTGDLSAQFHLALAAYYSSYSTFGSSFDPRIGFTWTPSAQSAIRASVGTTFQAPQLPELIVPPVLPPPVNGVISTGNPNLQPDHATEYSLGFEHIFAPGARHTVVSADFYRVNLRTPAATLLPVPVPGCGASSNAPTCPLSYPVNAGDAVYQGLELQATHQLDSFTSLRAGWAVHSAYLSSVPPSIQDGSLVVGEQNLGLPLHKATLSLDHTPPSGLLFGAGLVYEGAYNELNQPPFATLNANVGYRFRNFEVGLSGTNLTNVYNQEFTREGAGVPYGGLDGPIPTNAYALQGTALNFTLTRRF
jgi:outer membrane receptor protein involved in Fe transport